MLSTDSTDCINWSTNSVNGLSSKLAPAIGNNSDGWPILAYVSNNDSNELFVTVGGVAWSEAIQVNGQTSKLAPSLIYFKSQLILAYVAANGSNELLVTISDGLIDPTTGKITWSKSQRVTGQFSETTPALSVVENDDGTHNLVLVYVATNGTYDLLLTTSNGLIDPVNRSMKWSKSIPVNGQSSKLAPAMNIISDEFIS